jgi:hypothetical protein
MAKKRRKKATSQRVTVTRATLNKLASLGASHHKTLMQLKRSARVVKRKTSNKRSKS